MPSSSSPELKAELDSEAESYISKNPLFYSPLGVLTVYDPVDIQVVEIGHVGMGAQCVVAGLPEEVGFDLRLT